MGRQAGDQSQLFYLFNLEERVPTSHLLRRINPTVTHVLVGLREKLEPFYSELGRPSIDPELMIRMLIVGYCYGVRSERRLCEEVEMHLAYRWFSIQSASRKTSCRSNWCSYSINSSARATSAGAMVRPIALAVLELITSTNLVGCSTGRSAGFAPLRILST
jgi:Transposase domain (DUF772)